jgi:hypothetical protein
VPDSKISLPERRSEEHIYLIHPLAHKSKIYLQILKEKENETPYFVMGSYAPGCPGVIVERLRASDN